MNKIDMLEIFYQLLKYNDCTNNIIGIGQGHKYVRGENTGKKALTVLVRKKFKPASLRGDTIVPKVIEDVPTDIIEVGDIQLLQDRLQFRRPAQPGISLSHYRVSAGTFGAVVKDKDTGKLLILSNNHVLANISNGNDDRANIGDPIIQPGIFDGGRLENDTFAHLWRFVPVHREVDSPHCKIAQKFETILNKCIQIFRPEYQVRVFRESKKLNFVDCAVAMPLNPQDINAEILDLGTVAGIKEATLGLVVKKSGRTTGVTTSQILATNVTFKVSMNHHEYGIFTDQILAGPMSMPGDSGSLVLTNDNFAVGLLFAGSEQATMLNKIGHVLEQLDITF
ncbi:S1 family peptidase [Sporomusa acidovorans]|uniref:Uncharacterized protein n=1 Tax=Sporomusa acidovorans (strain ATCC 49682 / DSM 3132 / Mol) TaxID=1123286 RepID=A0ABZ3J3H4_SPOA4|nr:S1 family peptidase [Sporomusa acidovorans]OZC20178.1 hypothetical protein SPACI_25760 [Sporomusa acidovorans DSM 3132]SDD42898.1 hypothetical protein SAMN04488499_1001212 [Sporomusa acidovorans]